MRPPEPTSPKPTSPPGKEEQKQETNTYDNNINMIHEQAIDEKALRVIPTIQIGDAAPSGHVPSSLDVDVLGMYTDEPCQQMILNLEWNLETASNHRLEEQAGVPVPI